MATRKEEKRPLCFIIGPIGKDGSTERKHSDLLLHAVIKEALEAEEFGYQAKRADEDADPRMIGDRVISDIINADLVVADLTDLNPNAFYELGIRHSTEKPTIYVAKIGTILPFDNVSHRTIFVDLTDWQSITTARVRLAESARAIKSPEFKVSNPITQANASFRMRESSDPRDRVLAQVQERLIALEGKRSLEGANMLTSRGRLVARLMRLHSQESGNEYENIQKFINDVLQVSDYRSAFYRELSDDTLIVAFETHDGKRESFIWPLGISVNIS